MCVAEYGVWMECLLIWVDEERMKRLLDDDPLVAQALFVGVCVGFGWQRAAQGKKGRNATQLEYWHKLPSDIFLGLIQKIHFRQPFVLLLYVACRSVREFSSGCLALQVAARSRLHRACGQRQARLVQRAPDAARQAQNQSSLEGGGWKGGVV